MIPATLQRWVFAVCFFALLPFLGCTHVIPVKTDPDAMPEDYSLFKRQPERYSFPVAVVIGDETRKFTVSQHGTVFPVGEALWELSMSSFAEIFRSYDVVPDVRSAPYGTDRILVFRFGPLSAFRYGITMFHDHTAEIQLVGEMYDRKNRLLWKGTATGTRKANISEAAAQQMSGGSSGGIFAFMTPPQDPQDVALGDMVHDALSMALEEMKYELVVKARKAILPPK